MDLSLFDYAFPKELVAQHPLPRREDSRMMVIDRRQKKWEHQHFLDLPTHLQAGDLLVMNNALADLVDMDGRLVPALPPYIKRKKPEDFTEEDFTRYRTVYGRVPGSKAAPTAGFHFSEAMLTTLKQKGVEVGFVTLQVSDDTYKPIRSQNILEHPMHGESFEVPVETAKAVSKAKMEHRRIVAVGTTTVRALESWAISRKSQGFPKGSEDLLERSDFRRNLKENPATSGMTHLFISPGFQFQVVDAMITNFHRPRSTVLVMVSAFAGREFILSAYEDAIREKYRLFSYGDCMLVT